MEEERILYNYQKSKSLFEGFKGNLSKKKMNTLYQIIENEVKYYKDTELDLNPTFAPTMGDVYSLIDMYSVSRFRDVHRDSLGYKKVFYNICNFPTEVAAKMLDVDTKQIFMTAEDGVSYWPSWLMTKELKFWMKDKFFGRQLNEYALKWPKYGDLWVKKVGDDVKWVPPQNMIYRVNAVDYKTIPLIERHEYGIDELRVTGKKLGWENIEKAIKKADGDTIVVHECSFPKGYLENEKSNYFVIPEDMDISLADDKRDLSYKKLAWEELPGRLAGRGRIEQLFEDQIYLNRIANYKSEGYHWSSKKVFQTRDTGIDKNMMTQMDNGEILIVNNEIKPIINEERNLAAYTSDERRWEENAMRRSFAREPITGGRAPAGTPLGSTILQTQMAAGFYKQKKEELGDFIKEILWDWILPQFKNQKRKEHKVLMRSLLSDEDEGSDKFFSMQLNEKMNDLRFKSKHLTPDQWKIRRSIQAELLKGADVTIPKSLYDNIKAKMNIIITGEQIDATSIQRSLDTITMILGQNPRIMDDKRIRKIIYKRLDLAGINPKDFFGDEVPGISEMAGEVRAQQVSGSVAAPKTPVAPAMAATESTL